MIETWESNDTIRILLEGDLDAGRVELLRPRFQRLMGEGGRFFLVDFSRARFMCSSGLGLLVEFYNRLLQQGGGLRVENLPPQIQKLLADTKLLAVLTEEGASPGAEVDVLWAVQQHMGRELLFLSYLNTITSNVLQADFTETIYETTLEGIMRSLKSPSGMLVLIGADTEGRRALSVAASQGFSTETRSRIEQMPLIRQSFEGECLASQQARLFSASSGDGRVADSPLLEALGCREGVLAPIVGRREALGLVVVAAAEDGTSFLPHSVPLLEVFSNVCGLAIEKQALLENIQRKNTQLAEALDSLNKAQSSLMEAGKLAVTAAMMRGLAHAVNNKLVPIIGYSQMLAMQFQPGDKTLDKVRIIESASNDIRRIVDNLKAQVMRDMLHIELHDIRDVIDSTLSMMGSLFRERGVQVERVYPARTEDYRLGVDRERLVQAFLSLLNRVPGSCDGGRAPYLRIEVERGEEEMVVRLVDNGHSIPSAELRGFLNPFDGSEGPYALDRLNFSIANGVVKDHRGTLTITPLENDGGLCAEMRLPLARTPENTIYIG
ncbi:MAG TPA: GAF domain-containing protein [Candidatus Sumerlaeota bacterium]|nr:GAF domain-containing protein [Candidatus Sumerlaeota bacterium]